MHRSIKFTKQFKKQFRKRKQDPKWYPIFHNPLPEAIDPRGRTPWEFIIACLINDDPIPDYFYVHALEGLSDLKHQIKRQLNNPQLTIIILELHFDSHSGDHLLVFVPTEEIVFFGWYWDT
ncbi:hypothetical protein [Lentilactobacillus kisonensis]|uniref:Replication associated protein n=1 Tax=Lentilactobacillus kisonensis DSM 19906 = JCM 15041 TaxID=1423766 RepID=A0A0R1NII9_9LACO|nr:hypothetical protein [Lentilactobacillus kisonensis]KRL20327.1 hypothetical protein FC98_GL001739 [Lentilactobacillus kisonensis DSM 19906 = JCM 15041]